MKGILSKLSSILQRLNQIYSSILIKYQRFFSSFKSFNFRQAPMYLDHLYSDPLYMTSSSPLPHVYPQDIDCVIRCEDPSKGTLYISNIEGAQNLVTLKSLGIGSICTCAKGYKLDHLKQVIRYYKYLPIQDNQYQDIGKYLDQASQFIKGSLTKTNVMVHCVAGSARSVAIIAAYLIKYQGMNSQQAVSYLKRKRKLITLTTYQLMSLANFDQKLQLKKSQRKNTQNRTMTYKTYQSDIDQRKSVDKPINNNKTNKSLLQVQSGFQQSLKGQSRISRVSRVSKESRSQNKSFSSRKKSVQIQNSRVSSRKGSVNQNQSIKHNEVKYFDKVLSSSHQQFCGVKRDLKNSNLSAKKQYLKNLSSTMSGNQLENQIQRQKTCLDNLSHASSKSMGRNSLQNSRTHSISSRVISENQNADKEFCKSNLKSKRSLNPEEFIGDQMLNSCQSSRLSPSKKIHFKELNQKLNFEIDSIVSQYEKQTANVRNKYHTKLRNIKIMREPIKFV